MPHPTIARQRPHITRAKDVANQTMSLMHVEILLVGRANARSVLAAMLQQKQAVINRLIHGRARHDPDNSAHNSFPEYREGKNEGRLVGQPGRERRWQ